MPPRKSTDLNELSLDEYRHFSSLFDEDVFAITVESSLAARASQGGTAPERVREALFAGPQCTEVSTCLNPPRLKISPSILSADFGRLGEQVAEASESGGRLHSRPTLWTDTSCPTSLSGPSSYREFGPWTELPLDVHLMIEEPDRLIPDFAKAGANILTVHPEACRHLHKVIYQIKDLGVRAGISLNPGTPASVLEPVISGTLILVLGDDGQPRIRGAEVHSQRDEQDRPRCVRCWMRRDQGRS